LRQPASASSPGCARSPLLPRTPNRTRPGPLLGRIFLGGLSGACLTVSAGQPLLLGALLGGVGALIGAFAGYQIRKRLVNRLGVRDLLVAVPEDIVAIALAYLFVSLGASAR